jgi:predicted Co/Zn/Cd cation transporter (cation efflux family)
MAGSDPSTGSGATQGQHYDACMSALLPLSSLAASTLLAAEETRELPMPAWAIGAVTLLALLGLLLLTLSFGKGRDHT